MYEYIGRCVRVIDNDTYDFDVDLGFRIAHQIRVRLEDCELPALKSVNGAERAHAQQALAFVTDILLGASLLQIRTSKAKFDAYGCHTARVWLLSEDVDTEGIPYITQELSEMLRGANLFKRDSYPDESSDR